MVRKPSLKSHNIQQAFNAPSQSRYNEAEKGFLKANFKNEYHFLQIHGLSIYKEDDRDEGKAILRKLMQAETDNGAEEDQDPDMSQFEKDLEADPMSHLADRHFSAAELDVIEKHYRHSANFMRTYGLKPFDDEDCGEAKQIVAQMVNQ